MLNNFIAVLRKNKKLIITFVLIILAYKFVLFLSAFLFNYYTFKLEPFSLVKLMDFWNHWDANAYLQIAQDGYNATGKITRFFPLYPVTIAVFGKIIGYKISAYLVNTFSLFFFLLGLYWLTKLDYGEEDSWRAVLYYLIFPTAIFLTAYYSECLFLALAVWNFYFARQRKWFCSGLLGFLASLTRIEGVVLLLFMLFEYLQSIGWSYKQIKKEIAYCLFPLFGLLAYGSFLQYSFGDFFSFIRDHAASGKNFTMPWEPIGDYLAVIFSWNIATSPYYISRVIDLLFFGASLILGAIVLIRLRISYAVYVIAAAMLPAFSGDLASANRRSLLFFPIIILLSRYGRNVIVNFLIILLFSNLVGLFLLRYIFGFWTG